MKKIFFIFFCIVSSFTVFSQTADFTFQTASGLFCTPSTVNFSNTSTGSPIGYFWNFGNGTTSSAANPSVFYATAGTYTVNFTVVYNDLASSVTKNIIITSPVTTTIAADRNYICTPGTINFTATASTNVVSYNWNFGDGSPAIITSSSTIPHNYAAFGNFNVTVLASESGGCSATSTINVIVLRPAITATVSPTSGCIPANVNFNTTVTLPVGGSVINYQWDFGDGSPLSNTAGNSTNHSYNITGSFIPTLNITTNEGCTNSFSFQTIAFGTPPTNLIAYTLNDTLCGSDVFTTVGKANLANSYFWNFNDGTTINITDTIITHQFANIGNHLISVTPSFNGCAGSTANLSVFVKGVIAKFTATNTCSNKSTFNFNSSSSQGNITAYSWNFGDGSPLVNIANPTHTFNNGSYLVSLTINDITTGCTFTSTQNVYIADPSLFNNDTSVCINSATIFSILNNYNNPSATYEFHVAGLIVGPTAFGAITINPPAFGNFSNFVIIDNGVGYCRDTIFATKNITVRGPDLSYTLSGNSFCANNGVLQVTNSSKPYYSQDVVQLWYWNFGVVPVNDTVYQPQPYFYNVAGTYNIKLFAKDISGCFDSLAKSITINPVPFVKVFPKKDTICSGQSISLVAFYTDTLSWSPKGYSCLNGKCDTVAVAPAISTTYYAMVNNSFGCINKDSAFIKVFSPFRASTSFKDTAVCQNDKIQLHVLPADKKILWVPPLNISDATNANPFLTVTTPAIYAVQLTDSIGCFSDTAYLNVKVRTLPIVNAGPDQIYPYNTAFNFAPIYSTNVVSYLWSPSTNLSCNNCAIPNGLSLVTQTYIVKVVSDSGCIANDSVTIFVQCKDAYLYMPSAFSPANQVANNKYYPLTRGIKIVKSFTVYNRYGEVVYQAKNFLPNQSSFGWDGKLNTIPQTTGGYVYILDVICDVGEEIVKKGSFLLVR